MKDDNKIYMNMNTNNNDVQVDAKEESFVKDQIQEGTLELGLEKFTEDVSIEIVDGITNITMPEPLFLLLTSLFKKLNINLLNESEQVR